MWTELNFGKHKGKTLPQIMFNDPDWFYWAYEQKVFQKKGDLQFEADDIYKKSISIKIPQTGEYKLVAEYAIHPLSNNTVGFELVPESRPSHQGSTKVFRHSIINMKIPRNIEGYDKLGYKIFLNDLKFCLFKNKSFKMTRNRCEDFFNNPDNFEL